MTRDKIAELAGVSRMSAIKRAFDPDRKYILASTAARILAVPVPAYATPSKELCKWIPAVGTTRRLQGLVALGWQQKELFERLGVTQQTLTSAVTGRSDRVRTVFAQNVDELYRELQLQPAPHSYGATRARLRAARRGWVAPIAWDENIDDPAATPDVGAEPVFADTLADARSLGYDDARLASVLGIRVNTLQQKIRRLERGVA